MHPDATRYEVMRRSMANVKQVDVVAGTPTVIVPRSYNRVALLLFSGPTAATSRIGVKPLESTTVLGNFILGRTQTDAATTQHSNYQLLALNVWDHGDAVNLGWIADAVTADAVVTVVEVLDPKAPL